MWLHPISHWCPHSSEAAKLLVACRRHPFIYCSSEQAWTSSDVCPYLLVTFSGSKSYSTNWRTGKVMDIFFLLNKMMDDGRLLANKGQTQIISANVTTIYNAHQRIRHCGLWAAVNASIRSERKNSIRTFVILWGLNWGLMRTSACLAVKCVQEVMIFMV